MAFGLGTIHNILKNKNNTTELEPVPLTDKINTQKNVKYNQAIY